jgi:2-oxoglutarate ferredoxin oxidoreductase subunit beta
LFAFDVGCNGNESDKLGTYTVHGLHGRVIPLASGAAIANAKEKVIATAGDGATFSEGIHHLVHGIRNDYPILFICHNNENYGLTTGQASSATRKGVSMNASPDGVFAEPINLCEFVLNLHPSFVARGFSGDVKHMTQIIQKGLRHNGFAFIEIMQVCPTYNKATSQEWFWKRIQYLEDVKAYDSSDLKMAKKYAADIEKKIHLGVLYQKQHTDFFERITARKGKETTLTEEVRPYDVSRYIAEFI